MTADVRVAVAVGCLVLAGCNGEAGPRAGEAGTEDRVGDEGPQSPPAEDGTEALERALLDRSGHPRVSAARCSDRVPGGDRGPFGREGRGPDVVVRCTLENRGATGVYSVQVLENGCFVAALRRSVARPEGAAPVGAIHACGEPDLLERLRG